MRTDATQFDTYLCSLSPDYRGAWAHAAARTAGVFATWSGRVQTQLATNFFDMALQLGQSAQITAPAPPADSKVGGTCLGRVAFGLAAIETDFPDPPLASLRLLVQLIGIVLRISEAHRARGETHGLDQAADSLGVVGREWRTQVECRGGYW
jgi:hypothetical protein